MKSGKLRHRIVIQQNTPTRDSDGAELDNWVTVATVWGAVIPLTGRERFIQRGDQVVAEASTRIELRYRSGLDVKMRCTWDGHIYDVQQVKDIDGTRREIHLMCSEVNP